MTHRKTDQLETFSQIGKALTSSLEIKDVLATVMEKIGDLIEPNNWSLMLYDEESEELRIEIAVGEHMDKTNTLDKEPLYGIADQVARSGTPLLVADASKDPVLTKEVREVTGFSIGSVVCVPLKTRAKTLGVIQLLNGDGHRRFNEKDLLLLTALADYTAIGIENATLFKKVQELTIIDDVTLLNNTRHLHQMLEYEIERARRHKHHLSLIFLDLDDFKGVNDTHGHLVGSGLLKEVGQLIKKTLRCTDTVYRYGGDEFVFLAPMINKADAHNVAEKIRSVLEKHLFLKDKGLEHRLTASFGVATFPDDADNALDLLHLADQAMYNIKSKAKNGVATA